MFKIPKIIILTLIISILARHNKELIGKSSVFSVPKGSVESENNPLLSVSNFKFPNNDGFFGSGSGALKLEQEENNITIKTKIMRI